MAFDVRLGVFSKLYVNSGTYASPVWDEVDLISDLTSTASWDKAESSARRTQVKTNEPSMLDLSLAGKVRTDYQDTQYGVLRDAFLQKTVLDVMVLNGAHDREGSQGFRYDSKVFTFGEDQALGNVIYNDLDISPCASENDPQAVIVTGGVPVFSDIAVEPS